MWKGVEPRPIMGFFIVLVIIVIVATNQELLLLPDSVKIFGVAVIGYISYSVIKTESERPSTRK